MHQHDPCTSPKSVEPTFLNERNFRVSRETLNGSLLFVQSNNSPLLHAPATIMERVRHADPIHLSESHDAALFARLRVAST